MNTMNEHTLITRDNVVAQPIIALRPAVPKAQPGGIEVSWAKHQDEVRAAQKLRFDVFADEMGARLNTPDPGHDVDLFDNFCEHLLVRDQATQQVIGTYRVLTQILSRKFYFATSQNRLRLCKIWKRNTNRHLTNQTVHLRL